MSKSNGGESQLRGFVVVVALTLMIKFAGPSVTSFLAKLINPEFQSGSNVDHLPSKDFVDFDKVLGR